MSRELAAADPFSNARVIVQWNNDPATEHHKVLNRGGILHQVHRSINAGTYTLPVYELQDLANDPDVKYIAPDRPLRAKLDYTAAAINAAAVWSAGYDGTGIGVAVIDSGMSPHPNLAGSPKLIAYSYDFVGGNGQDRYGHGEHVAGIIAANGRGCSDCTRIFKGIAPGVTLINLRVLDAEGNGRDSDVISAIEMAISLKSKYNIRVINLSLGRPVYESYTQDPLCQAVEAAWKAGIAVVVAAGNDGRDNSFGEQGYGTINAPGNDPYVITVGSMKTESTYDRTDDLIASYSSKGPTQIDHIVKPDVVAPGNQVVSLKVHNSTLATETGEGLSISYYQRAHGKVQTENSAHPAPTSNQFLMLSGTSMAAAAVSGAVADLFQANPSLTPDQVKILLMQTAYKTFPQSSTVTDATGSYTDYYDIFTVGSGYIDLAAALAAIHSVPAGFTALSPTAVYQSDSGAVVLSFDPSAIWGVRSIWGADVVGSAQSVWGASVLSGTRCIWGASVLGGSRSLWGASFLGANRCLWGADSIWAASASGPDTGTFDEQ